MDSILRNYPLPALFFYRREHDGKVIYDVIDGKQSIESILMFMGVIRGSRYSVKTQLPEHDQEEQVDWRLLGRKKLQPLVANYRLSVIEVDGSVGDIISVFVRINSTGKALTPQEKRRAVYYNNPLLKEANRLANRYEPYLVGSKILSVAQISRMKHVELVCELMVSMHQSDVINKKATLDSVMTTGSLRARDISKASAKTVTALNRVKRMFPKLASTRFRQLADFYSLVVLLSRFEEDGLILTDRIRNQRAWELLVRFSNEVDERRQSQRTIKSINPEKEIYRRYLQTVLQGTDAYRQRKERESILRGLLASLLAQKDTKRSFSLEQRRILFTSTDQPTCDSCRSLLSWANFTVDHVKPHSKVGRSQLKMPC